MEAQSKPAFLTPPHLILDVDTDIQRGAIEFTRDHTDNSSNPHRGPARCTISLHPRRIMKTIFGHFYKGYEEPPSSYEHESMERTDALPNREHTQQSNRAIKCIYIDKYNGRHQNDTTEEDPDNEIQIKTHVETMSSYLDAKNHHVILPEYILSNRTQADLHNDRERYYFIISPLAEGGDLFDILDRFQSNEQACKQAFRQIVSGVKYLHNLRIFHRDLKPENFVVNNDGVVYVIDFGQAQVIENNEVNIANDGRGYGTPLYTPPEFSLSRNSETIDWKKADVWALGVSLCVMLTNDWPKWITCSKDGNVEVVNPNNWAFQAICRNGRLAQYFNHNPYPSDDFINLLQRMVLEDVNQRISIDEILDHPWMQ